MSVFPSTNSMMVTTKWMILIIHPDLNVMKVAFIKVYALEVLSQQLNGPFPPI